MDDNIRTGTDLVPPGQYRTDKWPVLHEGPVPSYDMAAWRLVVDGDVETPISLTWPSELMRCSQAS